MTIQTEPVTAGGFIATVIAGVALGMGFILGTGIMRFLGSLVAGG